jgi:hypothetical protein
LNLFGDFNRDEAIAALERTFGALPPRDPLPATGFAPKLPEPVGDPLTLTHHGDANTAAALVAWPTGGGSAGFHESRRARTPRPGFQQPPVRCDAREDRRELCAASLLELAARCAVGWLSRRDQPVAPRRSHRFLRRDRQDRRRPCRIPLPRPTKSRA